MAKFSTEKDNMLHGYSPPLPLVAGIVEVPPTGPNVVVVIVAGIVMISVPGMLPLPGISLVPPTVPVNVVKVTVGGNMFVITTVGG